MGGWELHGNGLRFEEDEGPSLETSIFPLLFHVVGEP